MSITIKDVAQRAGVNASTVSRVINSDSKLSIREETKRRVLDAIRELGYHPNSIARNLRLKTSDAIGMLIPDITNPLFPEVIKGVENLASEKDLSLILCHTWDNHEKELKMIRFLLNRRVDGLLLASVHMRAEAIEEIEKSGTPYVLVNRGNRKDVSAYVVADNTAGAKMAVHHLIGLGHKKIAHIAGFLYTDTGLERIEGYRKELNLADIPFNSDYMVEAGYTEPEGYKAMNKLLLLPDRPTAVFAANDLLAMGAILAIHEKGLSVPEDISVVGFDGIWLVERITPALTTVKVPLNEMGYLAMNMLFNKMKGMPVEQERIVLKPSLVVRCSTDRVKS
ncbi:MAG: LacI family DNA-binding transcriptional regulator [Deltaproteobacteria bacterium]|nr:LacI family DNA-binding transcriptional regulator [Deltaproteobacteria bacterium]